MWFPFGMPAAKRSLRAPSNLLVAFAIALLACGAPTPKPGGTGGGTSGGTTGGSTGGAIDAGTSAGLADSGVADTWSNWALPDFFQAYCLNCHSSGGQGAGSGLNGSTLDFTQFSNVQANATTIRCGVAVTQDPSWNCASFPPAGQFPIGSGPHPSDTERTRLVNWIGAGLPE